MWSTFKGTSRIVHKTQPIIFKTFWNLTPSVIFLTQNELIIINPLKSRLFLPDLVLLTLTQQVQKNVSF